jgi:hypothetical protein
MFSWLLQLFFRSAYCWDDKDGKVGRGGFDFEEDFLGMVEV